MAIIVPHSTFMGLKVTDDEEGVLVTTYQSTHSKGIL